MSPRPKRAKGLDLAERKAAQDAKADAPQMGKHLSLSYGNGKRGHIWDNKQQQIEQAGKLLVR